MKNIKQLTLTITILVCCFISISAQENSEQKFKTFDTWISVNNQSNIMKGVLYEIKDSSILVYDSPFKLNYLSDDYSLESIDYKSINHVSVRRKNSVLTGAIIGSVVGLSGAIGIASEVRGSGWGGTLMFVFGVPSVALGAGIGALVGSVKIRIPINGNFENFKRNESRLEKYSYLHEYSDGLNIYENPYEHKWFIGLLMGPSLPGGDFDPGLDSDLSKVGGNSTFIVGYNFHEIFGVSASFLNSSYNFKDSSVDQWWGISSILAGPIFSASINNSLSLDMKPMIGYSVASLNVGDESEKSGNGIGIYPSALLRYNFSPNWSAMVDTGYLFSNQKFEDNNNNMRVFNLGFGIAYRFR